MEGDQGREYWVIFSSNETSSLHMFKIRMPFKEVFSSLKL